MIDYLEIGKIINTHGVRGNVKVIPLTDNPRRYEDLKWVYLDKKGVLEKYYIENVKYHKNFVIVKLKGVDNMQEAEGLKGMYLKVDRENAVKLPEDSYFICDLVGCSVYEKNGNILGVLREVIKTGANDVFLVEGQDGKEILIPALKKVVKNVLLEDRKIIVALPEGLMENEI